MKKFNVETWLPVFSGFYETIWDFDGEEETELQYINEQRTEHKLPPVTWDDVDWDYEGSNQEVSRLATHAVTKELQRLNVVQGGKYQQLVSPREYNFANDSVNVMFTLTPANMNTIKAYLDEHKSAFQAYLKDTYTSYDGFCSSYSNQIENWTADLHATLHHDHRLGVVLQFILLNENGSEYEMDIYEYVRSNGGCLTAKNYTTLINSKENKGELI